MYSEKFSKFDITFKNWRFVRLRYCTVNHSNEHIIVQFIALEDWTLTVLCLSVFQEGGPMVSDLTSTRVPSQILRAAVQGWAHLGMLFGLVRAKDVAGHMSLGLQILHSKESVPQNGDGQHRGDSMV